MSFGAIWPFTGLTGGTFERIPDSEEMQQDALDCSTQATEKFTVEKDIAAYIKREFDKARRETCLAIGVPDRGRRTEIQPDLALHRGTKLWILCYSRD